MRDAKRGEFVTEPNHKSSFLTLLQCHGGPGFEHAVADEIRTVFSQYTSAIETDVLGSLIAHIPGQGEGRKPRVLLAAHMDEIALIVTKIDKGGFLRVAEAGGFDARTLVGQEVVVHSKPPLRGIVGSKPPHLLTPGESDNAPKLDDLYIDLAMSETQVRERINVGDRVTLHRDALPLMNGRIAGKALDDRACVAVIYECLACLERLQHRADVTVAASVQEEVGMRGAAVLGYAQNPDIAIALDVTFGDMPGQAPDESFKLGHGPVITMGPTIHPKVFSGLRDTAKRHRVPYQIELSQASTGTDAWAFQIARDGIASGVVGVALRYMHTSVEVIAYDDIVECGRLLAHYIASIDDKAVEELTCY